MQLNDSQLKAKLEELEQAFLAGEYFRVIIVSPQLMVQFTEALNSHTIEYLRKKGYLNISPDEQAVNELMLRLRKGDSDRAQIASALNSIFESENGADSNAAKNFMSAFSKLEALISMRNRLAHEYYREPTSEYSLKLCAASGIELLQRLAKELDEI